MVGTVGGVVRFDVNLSGAYETGFLAI